ncbi:MAG: adenosine kinase [Tannerellaceae bacterium]|nr:adenosine kinase [Tannerellaceae bacterium]
MAVLGMGNALVDILLKLENDSTLQEIGIQKGAMDMINARQMSVIQRNQEHLGKSQAPGGSVCNSMRAISYLGGQAGFIGKIGHDHFGTFYEKEIRQAGTTPYLVKEGPVTGVSTILISPDGERTMATFLGPAPTLTAADVTPDILSSYQYMFVEGYLLVNEELVRSTLQKARQAGLKIVLDLANFNIVNGFKSLLDEIIPAYVDILLSNEPEAEAFTGLPAAEAIDKITPMVDICVVTLGKEGALVASGKEKVKVAAEGGKPVDTTGAGDNFAAGFLFGQNSGASLEQSARIGSLLAGYVIEEIGPQISAGKWEQIKLKVNGILK